MELCLRLLQLVLVPADEECGHVVRCRELPRAARLSLLAHVLEVIDHLLWLPGLLETSRKEGLKIVLVGLASLDIDAKESRHSVILDDWLGARCSIVVGL